MTTQPPIAPEPESPAPTKGWRALESGRRRLILFAIALPLLLVGLLPLLWTTPGGPPEMREAERMLRQHSAMGNTDTAFTVAVALGETMANLRQNFFTTNRDKPAEQSFPCHVWLSPDGGRAVVLVHIPELRLFDEAARESLAGMAWMSAVLTLQQQSLQPGSLTVATRGGILYDRVLQGKGVEGEVDQEVTRKETGNRRVRQLLDAAYQPWPERHELERPTKPEKPVAERQDDV